MVRQYERGLQDSCTCFSQNMLFAINIFYEKLHLLEKKPSYVALLLQFLKDLYVNNFQRGWVRLSREMLTKFSKCKYS